MKDGILFMNHALNILRVDEGANDLLISELIKAIPSYLEQATGKSWYNGNPYEVDELAKTTAGFILQLWYKEPGKDTEQLKRTIDNLLSALTLKARDHV